MSPDHPSTPNSPVHGQPGRQVLAVLWLTLLLNCLSAGLKLAVGLVSGNLTVLSDAFHGFLDAFNNIMGIVAIRISWRPPDANHPYGHRKFEALASLAIGVLMTLTSWEIGRSAIRRFLTHDQAAPPTVSGLWLAMVLVGLVINAFVSWYEMRRGHALNSMLLVADAAHTRTDIYVTFVSLSSLLIAPRWPAMDGILSLVVVGFILSTGWSILRENALLLTDAAQLDPEPIRAVVESVEGVINCHAIRTRGMPDEIHLDLHIVVRSNLTAEQTHAIESRVRYELLAAFPQIADVAIHHQTQMPATNQPFQHRRTA